MKEKHCGYQQNCLFILIVIVLLASCNKLPVKSIHKMIFIDTPLPIPQANVNLSQPDKSIKTETKCLSITNGNDAITISIDKNGFVWSGGRGGVTRWNPQSKTYISYTTSNGLAENYVTTLAISKEGYIWVGTHRGYISFFDGKSWNTLSAPFGEIITSLSVIRSGDIWIGTNHGIKRFVGEKLISYNQEQGLLDNYIQTVFVTSRGTVWVGTVGGVSVFDGSKWRSYPLRFGEIITSIAESSDQSLWFGSRNFLVRFDGNNWTTYYPKEGMNFGLVTSLAIRSPEDIWFSSPRVGIFHFNVAEGKMAQYPIQYVTTLAFNALGELWYGSYYGGVSKFTENELEAYRAEDFLPNNFVLALEISTDGALWIGTNRGISRYNTSGWQRYTTQNGLIDNNILSIASGVNDEIWVSTEKGLSRFDGKIWNKFPPEENFLADRILNIKVSSEGIPWLYSQSGWVPYYRIGGSLFPVNKEVGPLKGKSIAFGTDGNIYMGTQEGINRFSNQKWMSVSIKTGLTVSSLAVDENGDLWIGDQKSGVTFISGDLWQQVNTNDIQSLWFDPDGQVFARTTRNNDIPISGGFSKHYTVTDGLVSNNIHAIAISYDHVVWLATDKGVSFMKDGTWHRYTEQDGLGDEDVRAIVLDGEGNAWLGMPLGGVSLCKL